jgi:hypothetical protein
MTRQGVSRRSVLKLGAGAVAAAGVSGLAGCSAFGGGGGGTPATKYAWEPGEFRDQDHYSVSYTDVSTVVSNEDKFDEEAYDQFEESYENLYDNDTIEIDIDDAKWHARVGNSLLRVLKANYDQEAIGDALDDQEFDDDEGDKGFTLYTRENASIAYAMDGSVLLATRSSVEDEAADVLEGVIEVLTGDVPTYSSENDDFKTAVSKTGSGMSARYGTFDEDSRSSDQYDNAVAEGSRTKIKGDQAAGKQVVVYEEGDDVPDKDDREDLKEQYEEFDVENVKVNKSGRALVVKGRTDLDEQMGISL